MSARVGVRISGGFVVLRDFDTDEWDHTVSRLEAEAAAGGIDPELKTYALDEISESLGAHGGHRVAVERLMVVTGGALVVDLDGDDRTRVEGRRLADTTDDPVQRSALSALGDVTVGSAESAESAESADADGTGTAESAESAEIQGVDGGWPEIRPLEPESVPDAPLDVLPGPFRAMVQAVCESAQVDPGLPMTFGFAALSAAIGPASVVVKSGWVEPVGLFAGVVAGPGEGKSPSMAAMAAPLYALEREVQASSAGEVAVLAAEYDVRRRRVDEAKTRAGKAKDDATRAECDAEVENAVRNLADASPPEPCRLVVSDVTPERAAAIAAGMGGRLALVSDEPDVLGPWFGRYSNGQASLGLLLSGWSAAPVTIDRKSAAPVRIDRPALTVGLAFQPSFMEGLRANGQVEGRGLQERFLICWPASRLGRRAADAPGLDEGARIGWNLMVRGAFQPPAEPSLSAKAAESVELRLSAEASAARAELHDRLECRLGPGGDLHPVAGMAAKATGQGVRLAGVLHIAEHGLDVAAVTPISGEVMRAGAAVALYFVEHGRINMGHGGVRDGAAVILEWVKTKHLSRFSMRDLVTARRRRVADWLPHLGRLVDHGYLRVVHDVERTNSREYEVHPDLLSGGAS